MGFVEQECSPETLSDAKVVEVQSILDTVEASRSDATGGRRERPSGSALRQRLQEAVVEVTGGVVPHRLRRRIWHELLQCPAPTYERDAGMAGETVPTGVSDESMLLALDVAGARGSEYDAVQDAPVENENNNAVPLAAGVLRQSSRALHSGVERGGGRVSVAARARSGCWGGFSLRHVCGVRGGLPPVRSTGGVPAVCQAEAGVSGVRAAAGVPRPGAGSAPDATFADARHVHHQLVRDAVCAQLCGGGGFGAVGCAAAGRRPGAGGVFRVGNAGVQSAERADGQRGATAGAADAAGAAHPYRSAGGVAVGRQADAAHAAQFHRGAASGGVWGGLARGAELVGRLVSADGRAGGAIAIYAAICGEIGWAPVHCHTAVLFGGLPGATRASLWTGGRRGGGGPGGVARCEDASVFGRCSASARATTGSWAIGRSARGVAHGGGAPAAGRCRQADRMRVGIGWRRRRRRRGHRAGTERGGAGRLSVGAVAAGARRSGAVDGARVAQHAHFRPVVGACPAGRVDAARPSATGQRHRGGFGIAADAATAAAVSVSEISAQEQRVREAVPGGDAASAVRVGAGSRPQHRVPHQVGARPAAAATHRVSERAPRPGGVRVSGGELAGGGQEDRVLHARASCGRNGQRHRRGSVPWKAIEVDRAKRRRSVADCMEWQACVATAGIRYVCPDSHISVTFFVLRRSPTARQGRSVTARRLRHAVRRDTRGGRGSQLAQGTRRNRLSGTGQAFESATIDAHTSCNLFTVHWGLQARMEWGGERHSLAEEPPPAATRTGCDVHGTSAFHVDAIALDSQRLVAAPHHCGWPYRRWPRSRTTLGF
eukprot:ctg_1175.g373